MENVEVGMEWNAMQRIGIRDYRLKSEQWSSSDAYIVF